MELYRPTVDCHPRPLQHWPPAFHYKPGLCNPQRDQVPVQEAPGRQVGADFLPDCVHSVPEYDRAIWADCQESGGRAPSLRQRRHLGRRRAHICALHDDDRDRHDSDRHDVSSDDLCAQTTWTYLEIASEA